MNIKTILKNSLYVIIGSAVAIGISYAAHAATFTNPSGTPPAGNTAFPINVGTANQVKQGGLAVQAFIASQNVELDGNSYFAGSWHADPTSANPGTISFGGTDPNTVLRKVSLALTGGFGNSGSIASSPLANNALKPVCSDSNGSVVLCTATDICSNISGTQSTVPAGYTANSNGTCSLSPLRFSSIVADGDKDGEYFSNNIVNSNYTFHTADHKATDAPLIAILGLENDYPYGWIVDDFGSKARATTFGPQNVVSLDQADAYTTLLYDVPKGSYVFKISAQGKFGIKGKFGADLNTIGMDFYMRIHNVSASTDQWIHLDTKPPTPVNGGGQLHEPFPVAGKTSFDFGGISGDTEGNIPLQSSTVGDEWTYVPYSLTFQQTLPLKQGDIVNLYGFLYGKSLTGDSGIDTGAINAIQHSFHNSPNNFNYSITTPYKGTTIDVTGNPS